MDSDQESRDTALLESVRQLFESGESTGSDDGVSTANANEEEQEARGDTEPALQPDPLTTSEEDSVLSEEDEDPEQEAVQHEVQHQEPLPPLPVLPRQMEQLEMEEPLVQHPHRHRHPNNRPHNNNYSTLVAGIIVTLLTLSVPILLGLANLYIPTGSVGLPLPHLEVTTHSFATNPNLSTTLEKVADTVAVTLFRSRSNGSFSDQLNAPLSDKLAAFRASALKSLMVLFNTSTHYNVTAFAYCKEMHSGHECHFTLERTLSIPDLLIKELAIHMTQAGYCQTSLEYRLSAAFGRVTRRLGTGREAYPAFWSLLSRSLDSGFAYFFILVYAFSLSCVACFGAVNVLFILLCDGRGINVREVEDSLGSLTLLTNFSMILLLFAILTERISLSATMRLQSELGVKLVDINCSYLPGPIINYAVLFVQALTVVAVILTSIFWIPH